MAPSILWLFLILSLTAVVLAQPPLTQPLLVYNCAKMPAICQNVHSRNPLQAVPNVPGALGLLNPGNTPNGQDYIELTFDTNVQNKKVRRNAACPSRWKNGHPCPEPNQPPTVASGSSWSHGGYNGLRWNPDGKNPGDAGYNVIANPANTGASGMIWSCDEWPPAVTTQGGNGASTYCAPMNGACGGVRYGIKTYSEQDIQGKIHETLRQFITNQYQNPAPAGTFQFSFQTAWEDMADAPSAVVMHNNPIRIVEEAAYKRSFDNALMFIYVAYGNGTMAAFSRPMTQSEIDQHIERHELLKRQLGAGNSTLVRNESESFPVLSPVQQRFETLPRAPPLPIIAITSSFIEKMAHVPVKSYINRIVGVFASALPNLTSSTITPSTSSSAPTGRSLAENLFPRQAADPPPNCDANTPCVDGSCCNPDVGCGYGKLYCTAGNCTSNCDATAECGRDSAGGEVSCPLDVCCSYYGYCGVGTEFCSSPVPSTPCQAGFGSCSVISPPTCGGSSALGRSIAYYQVGNNYGRECQRISPSQINTAGLTHLNLAFASISPTTFEVVPNDARDVPYYTEFTALTSATLQTWIAIGGWDFNDPGPTQSTFSQLAASASNRATFISSLEGFMSQYGFQGVDIDWEYPGAPDRSGVPADTQNFVTLLQEMRAAFGTNYGISVTLPASYWYLRWFDPVAMEPYVDFFGVMTYDLHGPWDKEVRDVGPVIIGQTNIPEIYNWTQPLWYDQVDPSKINMGLAYYGRGYTVEDVDCMTVGCNWTGPSNPGPCTAFGGVMSLEEIENMIPELGVQPILDSTAMMKYLVWGNQWIGYDDLDTIAMKKSWASSHCFGGTMIWSIDLFSGSGSGDTPDGNVSCSSDPGGSNGNNGASGGDCGGIVYIDPSIWTDSNPEINCEPPCTFIMPPLLLSTTTTITFPPYVTSLDVAWSTSTGWTHVIQTTTLTIPPVTTTVIPIWEYTVSGSDTATKSTTTFYPTSSVLPPPFVVTDNPNPLTEPGVTHPPVTRTITPPPFPYSFSKPSSDPSHLPVVTFKPGPPGPLCKSGCGKPCLIFCDMPCLLNCADGGNDFADPNDPSPPKRPTPTPENDPLPTGSTDADPPDPPDPDDDEPEDEEEEDEDDLCADEFNLPEPVYVDPNSGANPTETISPATPPPTQPPLPNPSPPSPNPSTEVRHCFNSGASISRGSMIDGVNFFCDQYTGTILDDTDPNSVKTLIANLGIDPTGGTVAECIFIGLGCEVALRLSVTVTNGCRFTVDGPATTDDCGRIFREAIDKCDTSSTQYKQGGTITSNCAVWDIDPNVPT